MIEKSDQNFIVTAADSSYFLSMCQLIHSFFRVGENRNSKMICFDMGLSERQLSLLERLLGNRQEQVEIRKFDFDKYPDFVKLHYKTYAWKPIIIQKIFLEKKANVLWSDSANILLKPLTYVWKNIEINGQYLPLGGSGTLGRWTHPKTLKLMEVPKDWEEKRNRFGGLCGFSYQNDATRELMTEWVKYSLRHEYIKPKGANRVNHRDDQSLLTILSYKLENNQKLLLSTDEVDISSVKPIDLLTVRRKLTFNVPFRFLRLVMIFFLVYRFFDIKWNQMRKFLE